MLGGGGGGSVALWRRWHNASSFSESLEDGVLYVLQSPTEPVLDFLWVARGVKERVAVYGQATVAKQHDLKNATSAFGAVLLSSERVGLS